MTASSNNTYPEAASSKSLVLRERDIEDAFIAKLRDLKYTHRDDIRDRAALEQNFRQKFETLVPLLKKRATGRDISGLSAYE